MRSPFKVLLLCHGTSPEAQRGTQAADSGVISQVLSKLLGFEACVCLFLCDLEQVTYPLNLCFLIRKTQ